MSAPAFWFENVTETELVLREAAERRATCKHESRTRPQRTDDGAWRSCCWGCGTFVAEDGTGPVTS